MPSETMGKTIGVAAGVCVVCSVFVSTAAVYLKPTQEINKAIDKQQNILAVAGVELQGDVDELFAQWIEPKVIDLATGEYVEPAPKNLDERKAAKDPQQGIAIPKKKDTAGIRRKSKRQSVYFTKGKEADQRVILPVHGKGLWSTMYGFLALDAKDLNTIKSFGFYEHGETPGLGGEVDNQQWKDSWKGKKAFDDAWKPAIKVAKGQAGEGEVHEVDGLSGATLTSRGAQELVRFWLGEEGYGPFLAKLREGGGNG